MGCLLGLAVAIMVAAIFDPIRHCDFASRIVCRLYAKIVVSKLLKKNSNLLGIMEII